MWPRLVAMAAKLTPAQACAQETNGEALVQMYRDHLCPREAVLANPNVPEWFVRNMISREGAWYVFPAILANPALDLMAMTDPGFWEETAAKAAHMSQAQWLMRIGDKRKLTDAEQIAIVVRVLERWLLAYKNPRAALMTTIRGDLEALAENGVPLDRVDLWSAWRKAQRASSDPAERTLLAFLIEKTIHSQRHPELVEGVVQRLMQEPGLLDPNSTATTAPTLVGERAVTTAVLEGVPRLKKEKIEWRDRWWMDKRLDILAGEAPQPSKPARVGRRKKE